MKTKSIALYYRPHEYGGEDRKRVWRHDWAGDMFEILSTEQFAHLKELCKLFSIPLTEAFDED